MSEMFRAKVRKVGTSFGVLIPKEIASKERLKVGEEIELGIIKKRNISEVMKLFGSAKGAKPFERDMTDRVDRY